MIFASLTFIFFILPLFLGLDIASRILHCHLLRNIVLFAVSLVFYLWGEPANIFILLGLGVINYAAGIWLSKSRQPGLLLTVFLVLNLGILFCFKYAFWIISMVFPVWKPTGIHIAMPLGISFFTFHAISYLMDVYRKQIEPAKSALDFLTYFCMFPHLVAGPIVRYAQVREDLHTRGPDRDLFSFGMYRFLLGLNKKTLIANSAGVVADSAFRMSQTGALHFGDAWLGIVAYAIQIYFDFSAYSDMAIGLAALAGFRFEENFRRPYSSVSIREFWRRWHISLSVWLRDYLYIPLGGNRHGRRTACRNLFIVFALCGLWHGAGLTFLLWGLWHGFFLALERLPFGRMLEHLPTPLARGYTLLVVLIGWVFFRAESIPAAWAYLSGMFTVSLRPGVLGAHTTGCVAMLVGLVFCLLPDKFFPSPTSRFPALFPPSLFVIQILLGVFSISFLLVGMRNPFIYFNF